MDYWEYPRYVSVAEKRARAERKLKQLLKKNPGMRPVVIQGRALARTWWGKSWNRNLERYADYSYRIERGRSYVRHRAVLDLQIAPGKVTALVQGSASSPYSVEIGIQPIPPKTWKAMLQACKGKMASLPALLSGKFPKELQDVFMARGEGLFPSPSEINLTCDCPDGAVMCKHVAAALYGVGAHLDEDPSLFFTLRKADVNDLISTAVQEESGNLLKKAGRKSTRVIEDADLSDLFGIDLAAPEASPRAGRPVGKRAAGSAPAKASKASPRKQGPKTGTAAAGRKRPVRRKTAPGKNAAPPSPTPRKKSASGKISGRRGRIAGVASQPAPISTADVLEAQIRKSRGGISILKLAEKTGLDRKEIYNPLYRLLAQGKIVRVSRGVFASAR